MIKHWLQESLPSSEHQQLLLKSLISGDIKMFSSLFQTLMITSMSYHDIPQKEPEKVYHAFVLGLLVSLRSTYEVKSNRESGFGRYDVCLIPRDPSQLGIVMEFKKSEDKESLKKTAQTALKQIQEQDYAHELKNQGVKNILLLGLAFQGKRVYICQEKL